MPISCALVTGFAGIHSLFRQDYSDHPAGGFSFSFTFLIYRLTQQGTRARARWDLKVYFIGIGSTCEIEDGASPLKGQKRYERKLLCRGGVSQAQRKRKFTHLFTTWI